MFHCISSNGKEEFRVEEIGEDRYADHRAVDIWFGFQGYTDHKFVDEHGNIPRKTSEVGRLALRISIMTGINL